MDKQRDEQTAQQTDDAAGRRCGGQATRQTGSAADAAETDNAADRQRGGRGGQTARRTRRTGSAADAADKQHGEQTARRKDDAADKTQLKT